MSVSTEVAMAISSFHNRSLGNTSLGNNVTDWLSANNVISQETSRRNSSSVFRRLNPANQTDNLFNFIIMHLTQVVIPIGLILNVMCLSVFLKSTLARTATGLKMVCLAIVRIIILITLFAHSSAQFPNIDIPNLAAINHVTCAGTLYMETFGTFFTGLLMSTATIERFCCVTFPFKVKAWNLYRTSKILISVLLVVSLGLPMFNFWCFHLRIVKDVGLRLCVRGPKLPNEFCVACSTAVNIIASMIPAFTILVFSVLTGVGLYRLRAHRQEMSVTIKDSNMEFRITTMLLTEAVVFMIVRLPLVVLLPLFQIHGQSNPVVLDALKFIAFLIPLNHSTSFFVYVGLLPEFRQSFAKMMMALGRC